MTMRVTTGNRRFGKGLRSTALVVALFFTWTLAGGATAAHAAKLAANGPAKRGNEAQPPSAEERLEGLVREVEGELSAPVGDDKARRQKLKSKRGEIDAVDAEIRRELAATRKKLKEAKLPAEILQRHKAFVRHYESNVSELKAELKEIEGATTPAETETARKKLRQHREKTKAPSRHQKLDPNNLPHRQPKAQKREPRQFKEEFDRDLKRDKHAWKNQKRIVVAATGSLTGLLGPDELAETIEVQFTPEIRAKALELGNDPVRIYEWVRNNVEFVPTWGSIQGAQLTLETKQGNAFDNASLLIALLRAAGIQARYVMGTVELPIDKIMNWNGGFTDPTAALEFMASGGVPIKAGMAGGRIVSARLEHVWVEAFIDYLPSRGARHKSGGEETWISLDPSFKQYSFTSGIDLKSAVPFDAQSFVDQLKASATIDEAAGSVTGVNSLLVQQTLQDYQARVQSYIEQNHPGATVGDVLGQQAIVKQEFRYLLGTLPYKTAVKGATFAAIPDSYRHKLSFHVKNETADLTVFDPDAPPAPDTSISVTKSLPELAGKKITVSYKPASSADEQMLLSYVGTGASRLPAYLINLKPELRIDGQVVATGGTIILGTPQQFDMTLSSPTYGATFISNQLTAGTYNAVALNLGAISAAQAEASTARASAVKAKLEQQDLTGITKDDVMGEFLHSHGLAYWGIVDFTNEMAAATNGVAHIRLPSAGIFTYDLRTSYLFGTIPAFAVPKGFATDIDADLHVVISKDGNKQNPISFMTQSGMMGSKMEAGVYDLSFNKTYTGKGVSAAHILEEANQLQIPIYTVTATNLEAILPRLQVSAEVKTDIQNAVNSGKTVTIPQTEIYKEGWRGTGYVVCDASTGAGGYMISGGLAGGGYDCQCWGMPPVVEFIICALLLAAGIYAGIAVAVVLAVIGILVAAASLATAVCQLSSDTNFNDADREIILDFVVRLFVLAVAAAVAGIFLGGAFGFIALAILLSVVSIIASNAVLSFGSFLADLRNSHP